MMMFIFTTLVKRLWWWCLGENIGEMGDDINCNWCNWCNWCDIANWVSPNWPGEVDSIPASLKTAVWGFLVWRWCYMDIPFFHIVDLSHSAVPWPGGKFCRLVPACASRLPVPVQKYILSRFSALEYVFTEWQLSMVIESVLLLSLML